MFIFKILFLVLLFFFGSVSSSPLASKLDPITVSGSGFLENLSETISSTSIFVREDILQSGAQSLADFLMGEASIEIGRSGGLGSVTSFFIRGSESRNVLVFVDGVRVRDGITQSGLGENIPLELIERIEVVKGNVSAIYGDGAVGGVILVSTDNSYSQKRSKRNIVSFGFGELNTSNLLAGFGTETDSDLSLNVGLQILNSDGFSATDPSKTFSSDTTDSDDDFYSNKAYNLTLAKQSENLSFGLRLYGSDAKTAFDNSFFGNNPSQKAKHDQANFFINTVFRDNKTEVAFDTSNISLDYSYGSRFETKLNQFRVSNVMELNPKAHMRVGFERRKEKRSPASSGLSQRLVDSYFIGYLGRFGSTSIQVNARDDDADELGSKTTYFIGAAFKVNDSFSLFANQSTAFGIPSAFAISTNDTLVAETHESYEIGFKYASEDSLYRFVFFETKTDNPVVFDPADGYKAKNTSFFENAGFEISGKTIFKKHNIGLSWTFQDPESPNGFDLNQVVQSARRARSFGSVVYNFREDNLSLMIKGIFSSSRKDSDYSAVRLKKYNVFNLSLSYFIDKKTNISADISNLTNEDYELAYSYNTIPQTFSLNLSRTF